jgi:hypothetical protein
MPTKLVFNPITGEFDQVQDLTEYVTREDSTSTVGNLAQHTTTDGKEIGDSGLASNEVLTSVAGGGFTNILVSGIDPHVLLDSNISYNDLVLREDNTSTIGNLSQHTTSNGTEVGDSGIAASDVSNIVSEGIQREDSTSTIGHLLQHTTTDGLEAGDSGISAVSTNTSIGLGGAVPVTIGTGIDNVALGEAATTAAGNTNDNVAIGYSTAATGGNCTVVGRGSSATAVGGFALGANAMSTASNATAIGTGAQATGNNCIAFGYNNQSSTSGSSLTTVMGGGLSSGSGNGSLIIGSIFAGHTGSGSTTILPNFQGMSGDNSFAISAACSFDDCFAIKGSPTANNQIVWGNNNRQYQTMYLGRGVNAGNATLFTLQTTNRTGTDLTQNTFTIQPGAATGTGAPARLRLRTTEALGVSGSTQQTYYDRLSIDGTEVVINESSRVMDFRVESGTVSNALFVDGGNDTVETNVELVTNAGRIKNVTRQTGTPYTIVASDEVVFMNTDAQASTVNLPAGIEGTTYKIVNTGSSGNNLTVSPNGSEDLLGANSNFTLADGESLDLTYNATDGWY